MSKVTCSYCLGLHERAEAKNCPKRIEAQKAMRNNRSDTKVYNSYKWKKLRKEKAEDTFQLCEICYKLFKSNNTHRISTLDSIHHIVPINRHRALGVKIEDLAYDYDNLISLCNHHHKEAHDLKLESKQEIEQHYDIELDNNNLLELMY